MQNSKINSLYETEQQALDAYLDLQKSNNFARINGGKTNDQAQLDAKTRLWAIRDQIFRIDQDWQNAERAAAKQLATLALDDA